MKTVSGIITAHAEGEILIPSIRSFCESMNALSNSTKDVRTESILILDRPSEQTIKVVNGSELTEKFKIIEVDFGDQGLVRNHAVDVSKGDYIAFLDGDDLWSENWLVSAFNRAIEVEGDAVFYPEFNWFFEGSNNILVQSDEKRAFLDSEALRVVNLWDALCFCPRSIYQAFPYCKRRVKEGFAFEDWHWNRRVFEANIPQIVVNDTIIFKRRREGSQGSEAAKRGVLPFPTDSAYFDFYN